MWFKERWTEAEDAVLLRMKDAGATNREIAQRLRRSCNAVMSRISSKYRSRYPLTIPAPSRRVSIVKTDVPEFYECGWRFVGFDKGLCVFVWPGRGEPRWPAVQTEREAA